MKKVEIQLQNHIEIDDIHGFFIRKVTKFGKNLLKRKKRKRKLFSVSSN